MTTVSYPTLTEALAATLPTPPPEYVQVLGYAAPGDGGEAIYRLQFDGASPPAPLTTMPTLGTELVFDANFSQDPFVGTTPWTHSNVTWDSGSNSLSFASATGKTLTYNFSAPGATNPMPTAGTAVRWSYRKSGGTGGTVTVTVLNSDSTYNRVLTDADRAEGSATLNGSGTTVLIFYVRAGDYGLRISTTSSFTRSVDDFSVKECLDEGQVTLSGYVYLPVPIGRRDTAGGYIQPEMFLRSGGSSNDDDAFRRLYLRATNLGGNLTISMPGSYSCKLARHSLNVPKDASITIDGHDSGHVDLKSGSITRSEPWLMVSGPGYEGVKTFLTSAVVGPTAGSIVVQDASGISAGDWIAISSTFEYYIGVSGVSGYGIANRGEKMQVRRVSGNTIYFATYTTLSYSLSADPAKPVNVRVFNLGGTCTIRGVSATGPGDGKSEGTELEKSAVGFISASYFEHMNLSKTRCENFKGSSITLAFYGFGTASDVTTLGIKLGDPTNLDTDTPSEISQRFYGLQLQGAGPTAASNINGEYCRRALDCGFMNFNGYITDAANPQEGVITQQVVVTGGISKKCETPPSGHECHEFSLIGHRAHDVDGLTIRGMHYHIADLVMVSSGGIAIGGAIPDGPPTYSQDPMAGNIVLANIELYGGGIRSRVGFESLNLLNVKVRGAAYGVYLSGKHQSHVRIVDCDLEGNGTNPVIWGRYPEIVDGSDWLIKGCRLAKGTYGVRHEGADEPSVVGGVPVRDIAIDDNLFEDISTAYISLARSGGNYDDQSGSIRFTNNRRRGAVPTDAYDVGSLIVPRYGNEFGDSYYTLEAGTGPDAGKITLPPHGDVPRQEIRFSDTGSPQTITSITGALEGRILIVRTAGSNVVTLDTGAVGGNLQLGSDITLTSSGQRVGMIYSGSAWRLLYSAV